MREDEVNLTVGDPNGTRQIGEKFGEVKLIEPSWRRWPIIILFSLSSCHWVRFLTNQRL